MHVEGVRNSMNEPFHSVPVPVLDTGYRIQDTVDSRLGLVYAKRRMEICRLKKGVQIDAAHPLHLVCSFRTIHNSPSGVSLLTVSESSRPTVGPRYELHNIGNCTPDPLRSICTKKY
jgi:hypothetical protein